jgi:hypothetical protein
MILPMTRVPCWNEIYNPRYKVVPSLVCLPNQQGAIQSSWMRDCRFC